MPLPKISKKIPKSLWRGSVLYLIAMIILPLILLVLIISIGSTWLHQQAMRTMVGERDILTTRAVAAAINTNIQHRLSTLENLAFLYSLNLETGSQSDISADHFSEYFDLGVTIFSTSENLLLTTTSDSSVLETQRLIDDYKGALEITKLNQVVGWTIDDSPVVFISTRSQDQQFIVVGVMTIAELVEEIISGIVPATQEGLILIINSDQEVVYQTGFSSYETILTAHPNIINGFINLNGTFLLHDQNIEYVVSFSSIAMIDWLLVMVEPWQAVTTPVLELTQIAPLVLVPLLLISLVSLWFGSQQIVKPLQDLEMKSEMLSTGNFDDIKKPVGGITEIRQLQEKLVQMTESVQISQKNVQSYIGSITEAQEEERQRLARELHDDTIQSMIALKQRVQLARRNTLEGTSQHILEEIEIITEQTIVNLRRITRALRPIYLEDLGLVAALEMLTKETSTHSDIEVAFQVEGAEKRLSPQVELALYRITQEAVNNIVRHSEASQAAIQLHFNSEFVLKIVDNGIGFKVPQPSTAYASTGHFGLMGMFERAELIGANLHIRSVHQQGTFVTITYPASV